MYIRKDVELARYGYTLGCEGCTAAAMGQKPRNHSSECRARIEQAMKAANDESRLIEAGLRQAVASDTLPPDVAATPAVAGSGDAVMARSSSGDGLLVASDTQERTQGVVRERDEAGGSEQALKRLAKSQPKRCCSKA